MDIEAPDTRADWVSYKTAQKITGLSRTTLWKLANEGRIVVSKQGRAVRLLRTSLDELMWQGACNTGTEANRGEDEHSLEQR